MDDSDSDSVDSDATPENTSKLNKYDEQLKSILRKINTCNATGRMTDPIPTIRTLFKTLGELKDLIIQVKEQEHARNGGLISANETKADKLIKNI